MSELDVTLRDGRTLHVYDEGDPDGFVVVEHHGTPGSGLSFPPDVELARERGLRVVAYDRAGYGGSTPKPGRVVADVAIDIEDVLDALVDGEHRLLVPRLADDADDDSVEDAGGARDHVHVTVCHRVVRAGADRGDHASYTVIRAEPYLRDVRSSSGSCGCVFASVSTTTTASSARRRGR